jgi:hypothetical protein
MLKNLEQKFSTHISTFYVHAPSFTRT